MPKADTPRKTKTAAQPTARTKQTEPAPTSTPEGGSPGVPVSFEEIAARAYECFLTRGGQPGNDWADWFQAEAELRHERERRGSAPGK